MRPPIARSFLPPPARAHIVWRDHQTQSTHLRRHTRTAKSALSMQPSVRERVARAPQNTTDVPTLQQPGGWVNAPPISYRHHQLFFRTPTSCQPITKSARTRLQIPFTLPAPMVPMKRLQCTTRWKLPATTSTRISLVRERREKTRRACTRQSRDRDIETRRKKTSTTDIVRHTSLSLTHPPISLS